MAKKEVKKEEAAEVKMPESAVEVMKKDSKGKEVKVKVPPVNELLHRVGDEMELKGYPYKVVEVKGLDLTLRRTDIK